MGFTFQHADIIKSWVFKVEFIYCLTVLSLRRQLSLNTKIEIVINFVSRTNFSIDEFLYSLTVWDVGIVICIMLQYVTQYTV